jgi:hypothetical protein
MPISERSNDPRRFLLIVYDHHQPSAWSDVLLEEALPIRPVIRFLMIGRFHGIEDGLQVRLKLRMTAVRVQDMQ